jgi:hypothetical protein
MFRAKDFRRYPGVGGFSELLIRSAACRWMALDQIHFEDWA